jgi:hypothetical protein
VTSPKIPALNKASFHAKAAAKTRRFFLISAPATGFSCAATSSKPA